MSGKLSNSIINTGMLADGRISTAHDYYAPRPDPKPSESQIGGSHYKNYAIQPAEYCQRNQLNWCESNIVKYATRHRQKHGAEDIKKIIHYAQLLLEWEYDESSN